MDTESHIAPILLGQPTLRRRLKPAVLVALDQHIGTRFTIGGMALEDANVYIKGHISFAGRAGTPCSEDAITAIHP